MTPRAGPPVKRLVNKPRGVVGYSLLTRFYAKPRWRRGSTLARGPGPRLCEVPRGRAAGHLSWADAAPRPCPEAVPLALLLALARGPAALPWPLLPRVPRGPAPRPCRNALSNSKTRGHSLSFLYILSLLPKPSLSSRPRPEAPKPQSPETPRLEPSGKAGDWSRDPEDRGGKGGGDRTKALGLLLPSRRAPLDRVGSRSARRLDRPERLAALPIDDGKVVAEYVGHVYHGGKCWRPGGLRDNPNV